ncbi:hypothetical protein ACIO3S_16590 [Nocardioides sp. NPDC087217]|uniref:hypothetical protein n=1 Tax=Nocardioides sp. NPDC087217 TaxID=3364335 RepID=UPI003801F63C
MLCGLIGAEVIEQVAPKIDVGVQDEQVSADAAKCRLYDKDSGKTFITADATKLDGDATASRKRVDEFAATFDGEPTEAPGLDELGYGRIIIAAPSSPDSGSPTEVFLGVATDTRFIRIIYRPINGATGTPAEDAVAIAKDFNTNVTDAQPSQASGDSSAPLESPADDGQRTAVAGASWLSSRLG